MKKITFKVNAVPKEVMVDEKAVLLDVLRKGLHFTGAKQSCDRKGQCGACTVIVNKKAVKSCITKMKDLEGADVITVEGLGTPENPHLIQEAFVLAGAIQCGFCTPGMIMAAKALLDENNNPSVEEIKKAFRRNLCRCTGYNMIINAVQLAGQFLRGETTPDQHRPAKSDPPIGFSHPRPSGYVKACGAAKYTDDFFVEGCLELAAVRSPHFNAKLISIDATDAEKMPGVVGVITAKDIKGNNNVGMLIKDEPIFSTDVLPVLGSPIAAVVALTREQAQAAAKAVKVEYEVLPRIATAAEALAEGAPQIQPDFPNMVYPVVQIKGDAEKALASSAHVVEARFSTPLVHQASLEPESALAYMDGEGEDAQLVVYGRSIWIHYHATLLSEAVGWPNVRYIEPYVGGQFGIKSDITTEGMAAVAALHFKQPVRYVASLEETMVMTTKRHPYDMTVKLGADENGKFTAFLMDFIVENGAHASTGPVILDRSIEMLSGAYDLPTVKANGKLVYTNDVWGGSARGAGPPQANFAVEGAVELMAAKLKMDPCELRIKNLLYPGGTTSTGETVSEWAVRGCFERVKPLYEKACQEAKAAKSNGIRRGVGIAGCSFGIGGGNDTSHMAVELEEDGGITIYGAVADPGEGNDCMLTQIGAHCMNIPMAKIRLVVRDTEGTPDAGIAASSRLTYMGGQALVKAIGMLKEAMKETGARTRSELEKAGKPARYMAGHILTHTGLDKTTGQGQAWASRLHGVQMAEVEVNTETGEVKVIKMINAFDAGTVINPLAFIGQIEGGADQGAGYALREHFVLGKTKDWITYKFPTMATSFPMENILIESPRPDGPVGATGMGEATMVATHPAIANAVFNAIGVMIKDLPITPDKVLTALGKKK